MSVFLKLDLSSQQPRRFGIARPPFKSPVIKREFDAPASECHNTMPLKNSSKVPPAKAMSKLVKEIQSAMESEEEEDFQRPPDSSDEEEAPEPFPIKSTVFKSSSQGNKYPPTKSTKKATSTGRTQRTQKDAKYSQEDGSPSSSASKSSQKRKGLSDVPDFNTTKTNVFGDLVTKNKKPKIGYGSSQRNYGSKGSPQKSSTKDSKDSPVKGFKMPEDIPDSPEIQGSAGSPLKSEFKPIDDLPGSSPVSSPTKGWKIPEGGGLDSPEKASAFIMYGSDSDDEASDNNPKNSLASKPRLSKLEEAPATQSVDFKTYDFDLPGLTQLDALASLPDELVEKLETIKGSNGAAAHYDSSTVLEDDVVPIIEHSPRCPMCNEPVDADNLKAYGSMNTRAQEKFCRMHRKKSATEEWHVKGYPEIDWEQLDARVESHHTFIRKLIKGADSHYRAILQDKVNKGKDRNFRKMTSNLTPGYYGSRGLRAISENIMAKFTPLLKKQMVQDPLMSARGFTPFVQAVIVPEVTVLLIREDMDVEVEQAREILAGSAALGELLNEELKEIVTRQVDDSEDEDDDE